MQINMLRNENCQFVKTKSVRGMRRTLFYRLDKDSDACRRQQNAFEENNMTKLETTETISSTSGLSPLIVNISQICSLTQAIENTRIAEVCFMSIRKSNTICFYNSTMYIIANSSFVFA